MSTAVISIAITFLFLLLILELIVSGTWNKKYFTKGFIVLRNETEIIDKDIFIPSIETVESIINERSNTNEIVFSIIDNNTFGFREKLIKPGSFISYTPLMHGCFNYKEDTHTIEMIGVLNWFTFGFPIVWYLAMIGFIMNDDNVAVIFRIILFIAPIFIALIIITVQKRKYDEIKEIVDENIRKRFSTLRPPGVKRGEDKNMPKI